jgi:hypothetical protein
VKKSKLLKQLFTEVDHIILKTPENDNNKIEEKILSTHYNTEEYNNDILKIIPPNHKISIKQHYYKKLETCIE